jgi:restriction system protein
MSIPDYQTIMLPFLESISDRKEHSYREMLESLSQHFTLNDSERKEMLASGTQAIFDNRVAWAKTYLKKAGLLESPRRGVFIITDRGLSVLSQKLEKINIPFLRQFPEFVEFQALKKPTTNEQSNNEETIGDTPEEVLESAYQRIQDSLGKELIAKVLNLTPAFFERLVVDLLVKMGYGGSIKDAGRAIGRTGDEGIDGVIKEDRLGLDIIYVQAKRWQPGNVVGRPEIQKFVGALAGQGAKKGIFITTSSFTKDALDYAPRNETKIVLIDGDELAQLMIDYEMGVSTINRYAVKRIDSDYFGDE